MLGDLCEILKGLHYLHGLVFEGFEVGFMKRIMRKGNAGFSLVELIIVIAILAILAAAIGAALVRYVEKSRHATDVETADEIARSIANELLADDLEFGLNPSFTVKVDGTHTEITAVNIPNAAEHMNKVFEGLNIVNYTAPSMTGADTWTCSSTEMKCKSKRTSSTETGHDNNGNPTEREYIVEMNNEGKVVKNIYMID